MADETLADETLVLTLDTGESISLKVDDAQAALDRCAKGEAPFDGEWIKVGERRLIRCGSIVSVSIPGGESDEPFVAFA
jgi:hypothetical protein